MKAFSLKYKSPLGDLIIVCTETHLIEVSYIKPGEKIKEDELTNDLCIQTAKQLSEYFCGKRKEFTIPIQFITGTEFQKKVWKALTAIKYGETASYKDIACAVGNIKSCRAVGSANSKNPISIIVPCHRIINSDGSINGYAGGVEKKRKLLNMETNFSSPHLPFPKI